MTIKDIIKKYLEDNGYDGLFCEDCGCTKNELMPCDEPCSDCTAGYLLPLTPEMRLEGYDFSIGEKP